MTMVFVKEGDGRFGYRDTATERRRPCKDHRGKMAV